MKIVTIKGYDCFTSVPNFISISQAIYELSGFETLKIGHTRAHTYTFRRQLKITFLDILDYFEYLNDLEFFFSWKPSFLSEEAKWSLKTMIN